MAKEKPALKVAQDKSIKGPAKVYKVYVYGAHVSNVVAKSEADAKREAKKELRKAFK